MHVTMILQHVCRSLLPEERRLRLCMNWREGVTALLSLMQVSTPLSIARLFACRCNLPNCTYSLIFVVLLECSVGCLS
jgi:hypothetical protein